jgi:putative ABC transport system permease protein
MIHNYLKIALRNLLKYKVFSFINIAGLALGLAVSMLILLFVSHEISFDKFHKNQANIFQVEGIAKMGEQEFHLFNMSEMLGEALKEATPSVKDVGRKSEQSEAIFETDPKHRYNEAGLQFVDEGFFRIFDFKILEGDVASLKRPYAIMLTPEMALKYFGKENPIGKTLKWNKKTNLEVTGIVEKNPSNSSITFNFIGSLPTILATNKAEYPQYFTPEKLSKVGPGYAETYLLLDNPKNQSNVSNVLGRLAKQNPDNENVSFKINHFVSIYLGGNQMESKYVYIFRNCDFDIAFGTYQFHESYHRTCHDSCQRGWCTEINRSKSTRFSNSILCRIYAYDSDFFDFRNTFIQNSPTNILSNP